MYVCMYVCMYIYIYAYVYIHCYVYIYIYIYYAYTCILYIYIYIHTRLRELHLLLPVRHVQPPDQYFRGQGHYITYSVMYIHIIYIYILCILYIHNIILLVCFPAKRPRVKISGRLLKHDNDNLLTSVFVDKANTYK